MYFRSHSFQIGAQPDVQCTGDPRRADAGDRRLLLLLTVVYMLAAIMLLANLLALLIPRREAQ